jgi:CubicO group peptidase (beta-lactamase class C family)
MKTYIAAILASILILFTYQLQAQQNNISISGKVLSADDRQPVPSANISIAQKGIGTATNTAGAFILIIPAANINDTLRVSCLGFKTQQMPVAALKNGQELNISLLKTSVELKEVKVETRDALKIIRKAIDRIPKNYIAQPHITKGFYRNVTRNGNQFLQLSEAVFDIYNFGYTDKQDSRLRLIKARDVKNQRDFRNLELGWRPKAIFAEDLVKNIDKNKIFSKEGLTKHNFEVAGIVDFKGYQAYEITFNEKPGLKELLFRGKVFIDTKTFAFLYFDYGLSPQGLAYYKFGDFATRMLMKMFSLDIVLKKDSSKLSYQQVNGKWVLSAVDNDNVLYIKSPKLKYDFTANVKFNYQVTAVDTTKTPPFAEVLSNNTLIEDHDTDAGDNFWKDYNIVLPDFKSVDVIAQINAINQVLNLKKKFLEKERKLPKDPALRLDSLLAFYRTNGQFNGTALIKNKGTVILSKSYGFANKAQNLVGNEHTSYRIGSTAKTFTSLIVNQLVSEGKLDIHAPIKTYLPWYVHGDITLEQLITHQSGIPGYLDNNDYKAQIFNKSFTLKELVQKFCSDSLEFKSGTQFSYSNSGFVILALIAQEVSGKSYSTLLQERIFNPAGMTDTYTGAYKGANNHQAIGYADGGMPEVLYDPDNTMGAGGISSSASDLLKYHEALLSGKLLSKSHMAEMLKPRVEFPDYKAWYDYGWMTDKNAFNASGKHVITYHPGTDVGFYTMYVRQEDTDSCIILLNNTGDFPRYDMTDLMLDIMN